MTRDRASPEAVFAWLDAMVLRDGDLALLFEMAQRNGVTVGELARRMTAYEMFCWRSRQKQIEEHTRRRDVTARLEGLNRGR